ncbi:hypothetical protein [Paracoccus sediminicola]|uniref:hypothetical protein n=1 Tax=Paracoccus sediminicola TaxID=3017783 RepID=UPI0022F0B32C|nr:hypothetical protein [Paracoccus sediminicola]WBU57166.1 hypothetical protein PAF18_01595 [Paracoccus sediminicola]
MDIFIRMNPRDVLQKPPKTSFPWPRIGIYTAAIPQKTWTGSRQKAVFPAGRDMRKE